MLKPDNSMGIPTETISVAKAAFPKGNIYLTLRDEIGTIFKDEQFSELYPNNGQPAESPARLALVTLMQYMENIPDRQAADAVRGRIDWKYMLGLELSDSGFDYSILSEFRTRLAEGKMSTALLERLLESCEQLGLLKGKKKQRTDSTHVLASVRDLTLLELVGETMRMTLNELAVLAPGWLKEIMKAEWVKRYGRRFDGSRLPQSGDKRKELAMEIGDDGYFLLENSVGPEAPKELATSKMLVVLRRIWIQQYYRDDDNNTHWRTKNDYGQPPAHLMISSPQDMDIHLSAKRETRWIGYKVHFTETCEAEHPRLITQVETTNACTHDVKMTAKIQDNLIARGLRPDIQLVDQGYVEIDLLLTSQEKGIDLIGPIASGKSWQSKDPDAFHHTQFQINWEKQEAICPAGKTSRWFAVRKTRRGTPNWVITFKKSICSPCDFRTQCTRATSTGRTLTIYSQEKYEAQEVARARQETEEFKNLYAQRSGIEGTISQGVRKNGLRKSRYIGLQKTELQHIATAAAINLFRIFDWIVGKRPAETPISPFVALATAVA